MACTYERNRTEACKRLAQAAERQPNGNSKRRTAAGLLVLPVSIQLTFYDRRCICRKRDRFNDRINASEYDYWDSHVPFWLTFLRLCIRPSFGNNWHIPTIHFSPCKKKCRYSIATTMRSVHVRHSFNVHRKKQIGFHVPLTMFRWIKDYAFSVASRRMLISAAVFLSFHPFFYRREYGERQRESPWLDLRLSRWSNTRAS